MSISKIIFCLGLLVLGVAADNSQTGPALPISSIPYYPVSDAFLFNPNSTGHPLACSFCTILVNALERYTIQEDQDVDKFILRKYCKLFGKDMKGVCKSVIETNGEALIEVLKNTTNPDQVCKKMKLCIFPQCALYPADYLPQLSFKNSDSSDSSDTDVETIFFPAKVDQDGDSFSATVGPNLGYYWKGRDCNDNDNTVYPGRWSSFAPNVDADCNGISGVEKKSGDTYENLWCGDSTRLGVIAAGDSNTANNQIPKKWIDISGWDNTPFANFRDTIEESFSTPASSGFTGFCPDDSIPCNSVYTKLYNHNKCNFRDYHNIGVGGATIKTTLANLQSLLVRKQTLDYPALMFLQLSINDICAATMTTTTEFETSLRQILAFIDTKLPANSHLAIVGLIEDDIYARLANKPHPSGVSFAQFYEFARCTFILPCGTFLNSNATQRAARLQRAQELNQVYRNVISTYNATNFDIAYYDFPKDYILAQIANKGLDSSQLYNQMDGFHISQLGQSLMAEYLWEAISSEHPEWAGEVNPYNDKIEKKFKQDKMGY